MSQTNKNSPRIAGIVRNSFVDWPGKISFVVFLGGCNFNCPDCHNHNILCSSSNKLPLMQVLSEIKQQTGFIDGVVISGGEPTAHPHLREIITQIRAIENDGVPLQIKLDTNGSNFDVLKSLIKDNLVDFVAMDIKAPFERYEELGFISGDRVYVDNIIQNIRSGMEFLKSGDVPFMFRTTPIHGLTEQDFDSVKALAGDAKWVKNNFVPQNKT